MEDRIEWWRNGNEWMKMMQATLEVTSDRLVLGTTLNCPDASRCIAPFGERAISIQLGPTLDKSPLNWPSALGTKNDTRLVSLP